MKRIQKESRVCFILYTNYTLTSGLDQKFQNDTCEI